MASLISTLACGVVGAEGGTASIKSRGAATESTVYTAYDETGPVVGPHTLDANGGAELYAHEPVDVSVYDTNGALVREFTHQDAAASVEVKQDNWNNGARTDLKAVLTSLAASLGANDGQVSVNGTAVSLTNALGRVSFIYNPKSYGAVGDGVTDDRVSVQAAIDAAEAAGGGRVVFPPGTYYISDWIDVTADNVTIDLSNGVTISHGSTDSFVYFDECDNCGLIGGKILKNNAAGSNSGSAIRIRGATNFSAEGFSIPGTGTYRFVDGVRIDDDGPTTAAPTNISISRIGEIVAAGNGIIAQDYERLTIIDVADCQGVSNFGAYFANGFDTVVSGVKFTSTGVEFYAATCTRFALNGSLLTDIEIVNCTYFREGQNTFPVTGGTIGYITGTSETNLFTSMPPKGTAASASTLVLGNPGMHRYYDITGTTGISTISTTGFPDGFTISLQFAGSLTITDSSGNIDLDGGANFVTGAGDSLTLQLQADRTRWREVGRTDTTP